MTSSFVTDGPPYRLDLWSGEISAVGRFVAVGGRMSVPVTLRSGETLDLAVRRGEADRVYVVNTDAENVSAAGTSCRSPTLSAAAQTIISAASAGTTFRPTRPYTTLRVVTSAAPNRLAYWQSLTATAADPWPVAKLL